MSLFDDFKAFVCKQDTVRLIDHTSFCNCAVGEYIRDGNHGEYVEDVATDFLVELENDHYFIFESLNNGNAPTDEESIASFGELCEFMAVHEGDGVFDYEEIKCGW